MEKMTLTGKELKKMYKFLGKTGAAQIELICKLEKDIGIWVYKRSKEIIDAKKREERDLKEGRHRVNILERNIEERHAHLNYIERSLDKSRTNSTHLYREVKHDADD